MIINSNYSCNYVDMRSRQKAYASVWTRIRIPFRVLHLSLIDYCLAVIGIEQNRLVHAIYKTIHVYTYLYIHIYISDMESLGGLDPSFLHRFWKFCVVLVSPFASSPIQGHFGSCPVQIFRQSYSNSKRDFCEIPVVISKLSIYDIYNIHIYILWFTHTPSYFYHLVVLSP